MALYSEWQTERAEAYQILSQFFLNPPDEDALKAIRQDFSLDSKETSDEIAADFDNLFSSPEGMLQPIESLFCRTFRIDFSNVSGDYAGADLIIDEEYDVVPDHLSIELLFMSYLISNGRTDMELSFLETHIMSWVPLFCDEVIKQARTLFYREVAEIIRDFLTSEYDEYNE